MKITVHIDVMLAKRKMMLKELSAEVEISVTNLSLLKTCKAKGVRFNTLAAVCDALDCQPGDILKVEKEDTEE
jgi:putative transcriptional regulator